MIPAEDGGPTRGFTARLLADGEYVQKAEVVEQLDALVARIAVLEETIGSADREGNRNGGSVRRRRRAAEDLTALTHRVEQLESHMERVTQAVHDEVADLRRWVQSGLSDLLDRAEVSHAALETLFDEEVGIPHLSRKIQALDERVTGQTIANGRNVSSEPV